MKIILKTACCSFAARGWFFGHGAPPQCADKPSRDSASLFEGTAAMYWFELLTAEFLVQVRAASRRRCGLCPCCGCCWLLCNHKSVVLLLHAGRPREGFRRVHLAADDVRHRRRDPGVLISHRSSLSLGDFTSFSDRPAHRAHKGKTSHFPLQVAYGFGFHVAKPVFQATESIFPVFAARLHPQFRWFLLFLQAEIERAHFRPPPSEPSIQDTQLDW